jgi:hypothetical protein
MNAMVVMFLSLSFPTPAVAGGRESLLVVVCPAMRPTCVDYLHVMVGLVPTIHVFPSPAFQDVDGRDKPDHDAADMIDNLLASNRRVASGMEDAINSRYRARSCRAQRSAA